MDGAVWFSKHVIGKNTLGNMMQRISKKAELSRVYTCHCVRASTITTLFWAGVSPQNIMAITKHKNISSLNHYISGMSNAQKKECSSILSGSLFQPAPNTETINAFNNLSCSTATDTNNNLGMNLQLSAMQQQSFDHQFLQPVYYSNCDVTVNHNYLNTAPQQQQTTTTVRRRVLIDDSDEE